MALIGKDIDAAIRLLQEDKLVGIPTETVYGLAGNALSEDAVLSIFKTKNRPSFDPLIVHAANKEQVRSFVKGIPNTAEDLMDQFWPGPLTILLKKDNIIPDIVTSGLDSVACRIPKHPLTLDLLSRLSFPLAAPSANPFGYISPTTPTHVNQQLGNSIEYILDGGDCEIGIESTIVSFAEEVPTILRLGGKSLESIQEFIPEVKVNDHSSSEPAAPGMLKSHYAPATRFELGDMSLLLIDKDPMETGCLIFGDPVPSLPLNNQFQLSASKSLEEASKNLFKGMRELDENPDIRVIIAHPLPETGLGRAINDRLRRAAAQ